MYINAFYNIMPGITTNYKHFNSFLIFLSFNNYHPSSYIVFTYIQCWKTPSNFIILFTICIKYQPTSHIEIFAQS